MPIVEVEIILRPGESIPDGIASELADELGRIFGSPRGNVSHIRVSDKIQDAVSG
jgi:hypothetical protein